MAVAWTSALRTARSLVFEDGQPTGLIKGGWGQRVLMGTYTPYHQFESSINRHRWVSINHPDRLKHPLIWRNGKLEEASWDEAMGLIVDRAKDIQRRLTNHGIGFYTSGQLLLEEYYVLAMVGKAGLNTLHMYANPSFISILLTR